MCVFNSFNFDGYHTTVFIKIYLAGIYMNDTWVSAPLTFFILITIVLFVRAYWIYRKIPKDYE